MTTRRIGILGAAAAAIIASGCSGAGADKGSDSAQLGDQLGEDVGCGGTGWNATTGVLAVTVGTSKTLVITPGNAVVKANGHTCVDSKNVAIALSKVNAISVTGTSAVADTLVLDFSLGIPTGNLVKAATTTTGITVDGQGGPDNVIIKGSSAADFVTAGLDATGLESIIDVSLTSAAQKTPPVNILLKNITAAGSSAHLIFSLGAGADTFNGLGKGTATGATVMSNAVALSSKVSVSVYGGAGDDTIVGGMGDDSLYGEGGNDTITCATSGDGADYIDGGGDSGDIVDYSARTNPIFADLDSTKALYWGADLRGVALLTGDKFNLAYNAVAAADYTLTSDAATPKAIVDALNVALGSNAFGLVGSRLTFTVPAIVATATSVTCADKTIKCATLGLPTAKYTFKDGDIGDDGEAQEGDDIHNVAKLYGGTGNDVLVGNGGYNGTKGVQLTIDGKAGQNVIAAGTLTIPNGKTQTDLCPIDSKTSKILAGTLLGGPANATTGTDYDWFDMGSGIACPFTLTGNGGGFDIADYSKRSNAITIKLDGKSYSGDLTTNSGAVLAENDVIGADVNVIFTGAGDDVITGSTNTDYIFAGAGNDTVSAGTGDDHIWGGDGTDLLNGEGGNDTFYEGAVYTAGVTQTTASGKAAAASNDPLPYLATAVVSGNNTTYYSIGRTMFGDNPGKGNDVINGGGSSDDGSLDKLDLREAAAATSIVLCRDTTAATGKTSAATPTGACASYGISDDGSVSGTPSTNFYINVEYIAGATGHANTLIGTDNAETFEGGSAVDYILGQGGDDSIYGFADGSTDTAADILCGGDGSDTIYAGSTNAFINGEGNELLTTATPTAGSLDLTAPSTSAAKCYSGLTNSALTESTGAASTANLCLGTAAANIKSCYK